MYEPVRETYERSGFGGRVGFGERPALVVIDLARLWLDDESPQGSSGLEPVLHNTIKLLEAARHHACPVFFTTMAFTEWETSGPHGQKMLHLSKRGSLDAGSKMVELDRRLERAAGRAASREAQSLGVLGHSVRQLPDRPRRRHLDLHRLQHQRCVRATVESAHNLNFRTIVVREAVGDRSPLAHETNLTDIDLRYADVVGLEETLSYLDRRTTP